MMPGYACSPYSASNGVRYAVDPPNVSLLALLLGPIAIPAAPAPASGLGQSWPNASDVSASPHFHVYTFLKAGVRYIQINDEDGTVRGAIAIVGDEVLDLPMGLDAARWTNVTATSAPAHPETVYRDATVSVIAAPEPDGTARLMVTSGHCDDPVTCSLKGP